MTAASSSGPPQHYLGGIALRLLAMASLSFMFVLVKYIDQAGIHLAESLFWRQALVLPFLLVWIRATTGGFGSLRTQRIGAHTRRAMMGLTGMACNFGGMIFLPMAEATTINLSVPIFAVIFAAGPLGDKAVWLPGSAGMPGLLGALVGLRPRRRFSRWA
ncbi:MAG: EamA/RhaT family transporter, partial [Sphingopyxis sp.]|nr:EamA/RhaT family transporter [Sphingopyxis sp.]